MYQERELKKRKETKSGKRNLRIGKGDKYIVSAFKRFYIS